MDHSLQFWAMIAEIVGAGSIITGLLVAWFQMRYFRLQQRNAVATNLAQTFYSRDLAQAISLIQNVEDGISLAELRELGSEYDQAAVTICTSFETMGLLTYKGVAPLDLVLDLAGGIVATMRRKLSQWLEDLRVEQQQPSWGEWFEWLGDQARKHKDERPPAHVAHKQWRQKSLA